MISYFQGLPIIGREDLFKYDKEGCEAAKHFILELKNQGFHVPVCFDKITGYETVSFANQQLQELFDL